MARPLSLNRAHWYAIKTMVGSELQVANQLRSSATSLGDASAITKTEGVYDILPEKGHIKHSFRGFIYVRMALSESSFKWILSIPKVLGFVSGKVLLDIQSVPVEEINKLKQALDQDHTTKQQNPESAPIALNTTVEEVVLDTIQDEVTEDDFEKLSTINIKPQENDVAMITGGALLYEVGEDVRVINEIYQQRGSSKIQAIHYPSNRIDKAQLTINFGLAPFKLSFKDVDKAFTVGTEVRYLKASKEVSGKIVQVHHINEGDFLSTQVTIKYAEIKDKSTYLNQLYCIGKQINPNQSRIGKELLVAYDDFRELYLGVVTDKFNHGIELNGKAFDQSKRKPKFYEAFAFDPPQFFNIKPLDREISSFEIKQSVVMGTELQAAKIDDLDYLKIYVFDTNVKNTPIQEVLVDDLYQVDLFHAEGKQQLISLINQKIKENHADIHAEIKHYSLRLSALNPNQYLTVSTSSETLAQALGLSALFKRSQTPLNSQMIVKNQRLQQKAQLMASAPLMEFDLQRLKNGWIELNGQKITQLRYSKGKEQDFLDQLNQYRSGVQASLSEDRKLVLSCDVGNIKLVLSKDFALAYLLGFGDHFLEQITFTPPRKDKDESVEVLKSINQIIAQYGITASLDERRLRFSQHVSLYQSQYQGLRDLLKNTQSHHEFYFLQPFEENMDFKSQNEWVYDDLLPPQSKLKDFQILELLEVNPLADINTTQSSNLKKIAIQVTYELDSKNPLEKEIFFIGEALIDSPDVQQQDKKQELYVIYPEDKKRHKMMKFDQGVWVYAPQMLDTKNQKRELDHFKKQAVIRPIKLADFEHSSFDLYDRIPTDKLSHDYPKALVKKISQDKNDEIALISLLNEDGSEKSNQEYWVLLSDLQKI
jgi:transcription antitermination factor NusG